MHFALKTFSRTPPLNMGLYTETCTGLQHDNIVHRIQRAFTFKMMYRNLGTSGGATNSLNRALIRSHQTDYCVREFSRWGRRSVMVLFGIWWRYKTPRLVIEGNLTARRYIDEVLEPVVVPFLQNHANLIQQDLHQAFLDKTMCKCYLGRHSLLI